MPFEQLSSVGNKMQIGGSQLVELARRFPLACENRTCEHERALHGRSMSVNHSDVLHVGDAAVTWAF